MASWVRIKQIDGRTMIIKEPLLSANIAHGRLRFAIHARWRIAAKALRGIFFEIRLHYFRMGMHWYELRCEVRSLYGRIRIFRTRKLEEFVLPVSPEPSLCENPCSCTCHIDRTPYIRRLYQFHASASPGDLLLLEEVLKTAGKMDACSSCNVQNIP